MRNQAMAQVAERVESKGRPLHIVDVRDRLPKDPEGNPPSEWYVRKIMKDIGTFRIGQWNYVYEADLARWLNSRLEEQS
jgi:hypothetical protein